MPSKSASQARLMAAVAHSPAFAKKVGISQSVGKEFNQADKGRKFKEGGETMDKKMEMRHAAAMKKAGLPKKMVKEEMAEAKGYAKGGAIDGVAQRGKTKGKMVVMKKGGRCG